MFIQLQNVGGRKMKRADKFFTCLFFSMIVVLGAGSGASAKKIDAAKLAGVKRVGVVSMSGDTLIDREFGITVFGNREESHQVPEWRLDAEWQPQLAAALSEVSDFEVVLLAEEHRANLFAAIDTQDEVVLRQAISSVAQAAEIDAVMIFGSPAIDLYSREIYLSKYGIFTYSAAFKKRTIYYVVGRLFLFTADGEELDTQYFEGTTAKALGVIPNVPAPDDLRDVPFSAYSPEQKEALRAALRDIPLREWAGALKKLLETK